MEELTVRPLIRHCCSATVRKSRRRNT